MDNILHILVRRTDSLVLRAPSLHVQSVSRTQQSCRCLELELLTGILHGSLLNHMTIATKVGVSYNDHMDMVCWKLTAFLVNVTRLSPPHDFAQASLSNLSDEDNGSNPRSLKCRPIPDLPC